MSWRLCAAACLIPIATSLDNPTLRSVNSYNDPLNDSLNHTHILAHSHTHTHSLTRVGTAAITTRVWHEQKGSGEALCCTPEQGRNANIQLALLAATTQGDCHGTRLAGWSPCLHTSATASWLLLYLIASRIRPNYQTQPQHFHQQVGSLDAFISSLNHSGYLLKRGLRTFKLTTTDF